MLRYCLPTWSWPGFVLAISDKFSTGPAVSYPGPVHWRRDGWEDLLFGQDASVRPSLPPACPFPFRAWKKDLSLFINSVRDGRLNFYHDGIQGSIHNISRCRLLFSHPTDLRWPNLLILQDAYDDFQKLKSHKTRLFRNSRGSSTVACKS